MVAAKEKMLRRNLLLPQTRISAEPSRQPATKKQNQPTTKTNAATVVNRISSYDFTARKFKKSPIGSTVKIRCIIPLAAHTKPRKYTGENRLELRRSHWAPELSLYRAYFVPNAVDPNGEFACECSGVLLDTFWEWLKTLIGISEGVVKPAPVGPGAATGFLDAQIQKCIKGLGEFPKPGSPCRKWYDDVQDILKDAKKGKNCNKCSKIATEVGGAGSGNSDKCREILEGIGVSAGGIFTKGSQKIAKECSEACNKKKKENKKKAKK